MPPREEPQPALGKAIRRLRDDRGWSQERLADESGIHLTWISELETGKTNPSYGTIKRIAAALEVRVSVLTALAEELDPEHEKGPPAK